MSTLRFLFLVSLVPVLGCGKADSGKLPGVPSGADETIVQARDLVVESSVMVVPLTGEKDLPNFATKFPKAVEAIKNKSIKIVWGKGLREGIPSSDAKIIAYEAKASTEGGWVVKEDGELYKLSASEFASMAPPAK
jgi:hypothetical protein